MKAEFHSESLQDLPRIVIHAESETEWRALQMFMRLMNHGITGVTVSYTPEEVSDEAAAALAKAGAV